MLAVEVVFSSHFEDLSYFLSHEENEKIGGYFPSEGRIERSKGVLILIKITDAGVVPTS